MDAVLSLFGGALQITLLDLTLCGDDKGVNALTTRSLSDIWQTKGDLKEPQTLEPKPAETAKSEIEMKKLDN